MEHMDKLDSEIAEMESMFLKTTGTTTLETSAEETVEVGQGEVQINTDEEDNSSPSDLTEVDDDQNSSQDESDQVQEDKKPYTNWKKRYLSLRTYHDTTVHDLRTDLATVKTRLVSTQKELIAMQAEVTANRPTVELFSEDEKRILGEDAIAAIMKANAHTVKPLQDQLDRERKLRVEQEENDAITLKEQNHKNFIRRFEAVVPKYSTIDRDAKFIKYMTGVDDASGFDRTTLFRRAVANGDVLRAATFYNEYLEKFKDPLAEHISPTGTSTSSTKQKTNDTAQEITTKFIDTFYDDVVRGRYRGRASLQKEIEDKIDAAVMARQVKR